MLSFIAECLKYDWGPFRLLGSHSVLIGLGAVLAALISWYVLPRCYKYLPRDQGRAFTHTADVAKGKPTGAGLIFVLLLMPVLFLVVPFGSFKIWEIIICLLLAMVTGYLDDISEKPWGEFKKGSLDLVIAFMASLAICQLDGYRVWLPLLQNSASVDGAFIMPVWLFVPIATVLIWVSINATNCSDGVDGLAGSLTLLSLFYLGGLLYLVIGHKINAKYFLVPERADGAIWAILIFTCAGSLGGYLWHNAEPSRVLMGDAGSRFLGLIVGVAVLASGNPFLIVVTAPIVLINGGTGLVKIVLLRGFKFLGFDTCPPDRRDIRDNGKQHILIRALHKVRFPLHDHCRKNLHWSNAQVLMRFILLQSILIPILLGLMIKLR